MFRRSVVGALLLALLLVGCNQLMVDQPKEQTYDPSSFFPDGASARPAVPDTVARGYLRDDIQLFTGKDVQGADVTTFPIPITRVVLDRGQERFTIYCAPCHGRLGGGDGMIVRRGFSTPPTFHSDRLRSAPVGHFFDVITNGFGAMPDYRTQIPPRDRWAIIAYIRALQLSQHAPLADVPPEVRERLTSTTQPIPESQPTPEIRP